MHVNISCGILRVVLSIILTFSLTLVFEKALVPLKPLIALRISSILAFLELMRQTSVASSAKLLGNKEGI